MVLYLLVIRFSLCCCTMPCHNFSLYYSLSLCSLTRPKCLGCDDDEEELEIKMELEERGRRSSARRALLRSSDFSVAVGCAQSFFGSHEEERIRWCQKREETCKRALCAFAGTIKSGIAFLQVFFTAKAFGNCDAFHLIFLDFCDLICEDYYDIFVRTSWSFWEMITTNKIHGSRKIKKILECQKCTDDIWIDAIWTFTRAFLALSDIRPRTLAISRRTADFCSRDLFAWNKARALAPPFTSREKIEDSSGSIDTLM